MSVRKENGGREGGEGGKGRQLKDERSEGGKEEGRKGEGKGRVGERDRGREGGERVGGKEEGQGRTVAGAAGAAGAAASAFASAFASACTRAPNDRTPFHFSHTNLNPFVNRCARCPGGEPGDRFNSDDPPASLTPRARPWRPS